MQHDIIKALEVWTLQNLVNVSIMLGILAMVLAVMQGYYRSLEKKLTLRVSIEVWNVFTILMVDIFLVIVVIVGYLVMNLDIMADIKMAVPFYPLAVVLFSAALVLRLFHGGHQAGSKSFRTAVYLMLAANAINAVGFTFVAEAPGDEYFTGPSPFWDWVTTCLRSNGGPGGYLNGTITFTICFPILVAVFIWGFLSALKKLKTPEE